MTPHPQGKRFRSDLLITEVSEDTDETSRFVIRDPVTNGMFELGAEELYLCQLMDGLRSYAAIRDDFSERFAVSLDVADLPAFYEQMDGFGLLEDVPDESTPPVEVPVPEQAAPSWEAEDEHPSGGRQAMPYRWTLFNPDQLLQRLAHWLYPLRHLLWLLVPGIPAAFLSLFHHQPEYLLSLQSLTQVGKTGLFFGVVSLLAGLFVTNLLSKIAQGMVCVHFGGPVGQFGFRLAFGIVPRFFINKRFIWDLPRSQRLWSFAAPLLTKLVIFVSGTLAWLMNSKAGNSLAPAALLIGHLGLFAFLFTANPLWRADGYNWLITYLELPRLRERAFQVLGLVLRGKPLPAELGEHERFGLLAYAVSTAAFLAFMIISALLFFALFLEARFQGTGVVLFLLALGLFSHWTLRYSLRRGSKGKAGKQGRFAAHGHERSPAVGESTRKETVHKQKKTGWKWLVLLIVVAVVSVLPYPYEVGGEVTLFPVERAEIRAKSGGEIIEVRVEEGKAVEKDDLLGQQANWELKYAINRTETEISKKRSELKLLMEGAKPEAVATAEEQLAMARVKAAHSAEQFELIKPGYTAGSVSALEYEEAKAAADIDAAAVKVAQANLELTRSGAVATEIEIKQTEIRQLEEQLVFQQEELARTLIRSPLAGRVVTARVEQKLGAYLREGDLFAVVQQDGHMLAEIKVPESDIADVEIGKPVEVKVWAHATDSFHGLVTDIAPTVEDLPDNPFIRVVRVTAELDNSDGRLKDQMTGHAKIDAGEKPVAIAFTRMMVRFFTIEMWSWLP